MAWEVGERGAALILVVLWGGRLGRGSVFTVVLMVVLVSSYLFPSFFLRVSSPAELSLCHVMTCSTWIPRTTRIWHRQYSLANFSANQSSLASPKEQPRRVVAILFISQQPNR